MTRRGQKKPASPARITYSPHMGILSMARVRCELKQLCKSQLFGQTERGKKKEKHGGHIITCLLTELARAGQENIWHLVMAHRPHVRHDLRPNIFLSGPPTQSISTYYRLV